MCCVVLRCAVPRLVLNKIEDLEATGGVEAAGRALVDGTGIWADMEVRVGG